MARNQIIGSGFIQGTGLDDDIFGSLLGDNIHSGEGFDIIYGDGRDPLTGKSPASGGGVDRIYGEGGNDIIYGGNEDDNLNDPFLSNRDLLYGGDGNDFIYGEGGRDVLDGGSGYDYLFGGSGDDELYGGLDNDYLSGGSGDDLIDGGSGYDQLRETADTSFKLTNTLLTSGALGSDMLVSIESAWLTGGVSNNTLDASAFSGNVTLYGFEGNDTILGGSGMDNLQGGSGNDYLFGGTGNDYLSGDAGNDRLVGVNINASAPGRGEVDMLIGGTGSDTFVLGEAGKVFYNDGYLRRVGAVEGFAQIFDFASGEGDVIQLSGTSTNYQLGSYSSGGITGTGIYSRQSTGLPFGSGTYNELIGVIQNYSVGSFSLNNASQFTYV